MTTRPIDNEIENVRVVHGLGTTEVPKDRSPAEKISDQILASALADALEGRRLVESALSWVSVIGPSASRNLPALIGQLVAEIEELTRLRGAR